MRWIGLAVVRAIALFAPIVVEAQQAGKVYRIGVLNARIAGRPVVSEPSPVPFAVEAILHVVVVP